jgi:hypothetical protein
MQFLEGSLDAAEVSKVVIRGVSLENGALRAFDDYKTTKYSTEEAFQIRAFLNQLELGRQKGRNSNMPNYLGPEGWDFAVKISFDKYDDLFLYRVYSEEKGVMLRIAASWDFIDIPFIQTPPILETIRAEWVIE